MTMPAGLEGKEQERFEETVARLRATPEERARLLAAGMPFDSESWPGNAVPRK
jgi:hypothetical protein